LYTKVPRYETFIIEMRGRDKNHSQRTREQVGVGWVGYVCRKKKLKRAEGKNEIIDTVVNVKARVKTRGRDVKGVRMT